MNVKSVLLTASALGLVLPLTPAFAQRADEGEIVVTARKRQESILNVPVTQTVLSAVEIERRQIKNLVDVSRYAVGLKLGLGVVETGALVSIRGFGTNAIDPGVDQSVSLNLDGLQLTQGMAYTVGTFDMAQVEVLKGPQALFFGKASPAGVVSIRTNDPVDRFEFIGRSGYEFNAREWRNEVILSGPISDTLGLRLASSYNHFGGYFKNVGVANTASGALQMPKRHGETDSILLRGTALFKPTSNFTARLKLTYTNDKQKGSNANQLVFCPEGTSSASVLGPLGLGFIGEQFAPGEDCKLDRKVAIVGQDPAAFPGMSVNNQGFKPLDGGRNASRIEQKFGSLELNYDVSPEISLTSVTGYYKAIVKVDYNCQSSGAGASACMTQKRFNRRDFTQELRADSNLGGPLNFTVGAFYQKGRIFDGETLPGNVRYFLPSLVFEGNMRIKVEALSMFGQARYKVLPDLELAGGARWTHEKRSLRSITYSLPFTPFAVAAGIPFNTPINLSNPKLDSKNWAPEATITYTPTDNFTVFGSWKRAYKSGSYNIITPTNPAALPTLVNGQWVGVGADRSFDDEKIQGFEVGIKTRLLDRQLDLNIAGYHYKASNLQVGTSEPAANGLPVLNTLNAASAKIYGIEADFRYRPIDLPGLTVFGAINWNRARFTSFPNSPCNGGDTFADGCNRSPAIASGQLGTAYSAPNDLPPGVALTDLPLALRTGTPFRFSAEDVSGLPLVRAPEWTMTGGFHYEMPVMGGKKLGFGGDYQYSSRYLAFLGLAKLRPAFYQRRYVKLNANLSLTAEDDMWELSFVGNNLTNKLVKHTQSGTALQGALFFAGAITGGKSRGVAGLDEQSAQAERGRELWVRLTVKFGN